MSVPNKSSVYDATSVSNECVDICFTEREDLVKRCMNNALDNMHRGSKDEVPSDSSIFSYTPSKENFVEYASRIMSVDTPPKDIMKAMMVPILEKFARVSKNKKRITFDPEEDDEVTGWEPRDKSVTEPIIEPVVEPSRSKRPRLTRVGASTASTSSKAPNNKKNTKKTNKKASKNARGSRIAKRTRSCLSQAAKEKERQEEEGEEEEEEEEPEVVPVPENIQDEDDMVTEPDEHEYQDCEEVEEVEMAEITEPDENASGTESTESTSEDDGEDNGGASNVSNTSSSENTGNIVEAPRSYPSLPVPLGHTGSGSMTVVSNEYFPDAEFVFPGIYILPNDSGYVLFCVDNGRYSNSWDHHDDVTTLTWVTANKDKSRNALKAISESKNVFVFRKISGENTFRYMGKVFRSGNMDRRTGTVKLAVC